MSQHFDIVYEVNIDLQKFLYAMYFQNNKFQFDIKVSEVKFDLAWHN